MTKYRKKPIVIDAVKWDGKNRQVVVELEARTACFFLSDQVQIHTLEGVMYANPGDYIVKGIKGELYPVKPEIFEATYEPVVDEALESALAKVEAPEVVPALDDVLPAAPEPDDGHVIVY